MDYAVVDPEGLEPEDDRPCDCRKLSEPAGLEQLAINCFRAEPGEQIPLAYHYHEIQAEAFVVQSGVLHVETPEGSLRFQQGRRSRRSRERPTERTTPTTPRLRSR